MNSSAVPVRGFSLESYFNSVLQTALKYQKITTIVCYLTSCRFTGFSRVVLLLHLMAAGAETAGDATGLTH